MVVKNIKIFINILLIAVLSIAMSSVVYEENVFNEVLETEETEETDSHFETYNYQNNLSSIGYGGGQGVNSPFDFILKERFLLSSPLPIRNSLLKGKHPLDSLSFFIRYCSLKIYS